MQTTKISAFFYSAFLIISGLLMASGSHAQEQAQADSVVANKLQQTADVSTETRGKHNGTQPVFPQWPESSRMHQDDSDLPPPPPLGPYMSSALNAMGGADLASTKPDSPIDDVPSAKFSPDMPWPGDEVNTTRWRAPEGYRYAPAVPAGSSFLPPSFSQPYGRAVNPFRLPAQYGYRQNVQHVPPAYSGGRMNRTPYSAGAQRRLQYSHPAGSVPLQPTMPVQEQRFPGYGQARTR